MLVQFLEGLEFHEQVFYYFVSMNTSPFKILTVLCIMVYGKTLFVARYRINTTLSERVSHLNTPWNHPEHSSSSRQHVSNLHIILY